MNILFVSGIYPPDIGGPATYVSRMAAELNQRGHSVQVLTLGEKNEWIQGSFQVRKVTRGRNILLRVLRMLRAALCMGWSSDIIYATGSPWDSWLISIVAARFLGKILIVKVVGDPVWEWAQRKGATALLLDDFNEWKCNKLTEVLKWFRNKMASMPDMIITPSAYLKQAVIKWDINPSRIVVIYNAVDRPFPERINDNNRTPGILTVARLASWKGIEGLIRITGLLPQEITLTIIGDGPLLNTLKGQVAREGLTHRVSFSGRLEKKQVFDRLTNTKVFVLNSKYEGLPHTILEAMASGAAVVATNVGGNPEVVRDGKNGFLTPLGDEKAMADKIMAIINDEDLRRNLTEEAFITSKEFSWSNTINRTEKLFRKILGPE
ncbi:glycosyltransferase family 4 protein [Thermodesulfobacteriota bacterium]